MGYRDGFKSTAVLAMAGLTLCGCMTTTGGAPVAEVTRFAGQAPGALSAADQETADSAIISDLLERRSALPDGSAFDRIAGPVLKAYSRAAESELKAARLRAQAASKNWLPQIGPNISLTSLSDIVAQLAVDMVLFDHGRKKAERAFAKADVELAAVTLSEDTNDRVLTALTLYLKGAEARDRVTLETSVLKDMQHFEWIMNERVKGGVSDMSDLNILRQKLFEIEARLAAQKEAETTAFAELNAMSAQPLNDVTGLADVRVGSFDARPLDVLRAEAERDRDIAQARIDRAGLLPGVSAGGTLGDGGSGISVNAGGDGLLGLGTGASLKAAEAAKEAADRRVAQATEDTNRTLSRLETRLSALSRQVAEASALTQAAKQNLDLFQKQYDAGQRQVMDVVGVYETFAEQQSKQVSLKYELALTRLKVARELGLLADGGQI